MRFDWCMHSFIYKDSFQSVVLGFETLPGSLWVKNYFNNIEMSFVSITLSLLSVEWSLPNHMACDVTTTYTQKPL